jgi:hypothetical protein
VSEPHEGSRAVSRPVISPQMVAAFRALSRVRYLPQPPGVRLTTLEAMCRRGWVGARSALRGPRGRRRRVVVGWRLTAAGERACLYGRWT